MTKPTICDQRDCPAPALHHIDLHGQDFHFCGHHWNELSPVLLVQALGSDADAAGVDAAGSSDHGWASRLTGAGPGR